MKILAGMRKKLYDLSKIEDTRSLSDVELAEVERLENEIVKRKEFLEKQRQLDVADDGDESQDIGIGLAAPPKGKKGKVDNGGFENAGEFMQALYRKSRGEGFDDRLRKLQVAAVSNSDTGGFAVPTQFVQRAFDNGPAGENGIVLLNLCDKVPMTSDKMTAPGLQNNSHAVAPFGIAWSQVSENGDIPETDVELRAIQLEAYKSACLFYASNEWLADSAPFMRNRLSEIFNNSLRWYIENKIITGTGVGMPKGALNAAATLQINKETGQAADTIMTENILKMWARLLPGSHSRAIWMANQTCFPELAALKLIIKNVAGTENVGGSFVPLLQINNSGIAGQPATSILGRPLHFSEHLPVLGDAGDLILIDPLLYVLGDRQQLVLDASPHFKFNQDKTTFRGKARFDGEPALSSTFTPKNGDTCGWCVKIQART
ncbi:MAG: phage major capsid protein [Sedimentisphaerales bacterium]|nr:phage major capsid protein [Sedimentisphaerales bacterium]